MNIDYGFQKTLDHIRSIADSEHEKGRLFERLMRAYFREDPLYKERFSQVWLWPEWARHFSEREERRVSRNPEAGPPVRFELVLCPRDSCT